MMTNAGKALVDATAREALASGTESWRLVLQLCDAKGEPLVEREFRKGVAEIRDGKVEVDLSDFKVHQLLVDLRAESAGR